MSRLNQLIGEVIDARILLARLEEELGTYEKEPRAIRKQSHKVRTVAQKEKLSKQKGLITSFIASNGGATFDDIHAYLRMESGKFARLGTKVIRGQMAGLNRHGRIHSVNGKWFSGSKNK